MASRNLTEYIESTTGVCGGKPRLRGRRITVAQIAAWHLQLGMSVDEISHELDLELASIHAALAFYFEHRAEIDEQAEADRLFVEEMRRKTPSVLAAKLEALAKEVRSRGRTPRKQPVSRKRNRKHAPSR